MRKIITYVVAFMMIAVATNCTEEVMYDDLVVNVKDLSLRVGETTAFKVEAGSGKYQLTSDNKDVAAGNLSESTVTVKGVSVGETVLTVYDTGSEQKALVKVTVKKSLEDLTLDRTEVNVAPKETIAVSIKSGNGNYELAVANPNIARASVKGNEVIVEGVTSGATSFSLKDKDLNKTLEVKVVVIEKLAIDKTEINTKTSGNEIINILAGSGQYQAKSNDENVAKVTVTGSKATVTTAKAGEAVITITDTKTGNTTDVKIIVIADVSLSKNEITLERGKENKEISISSGSGQYTATSNNQNVATVSIIEEILVIKAIGQGTTQILVKDSKTEKTTEVKVTVTIADIALSASSISVRATENGAISISAGSGNYEVSSSNGVIATAAINGNNIVIAGKTIGSTKITVKDKVTGKEATINVTVSSKQNITLSQTTVEVNEANSKNINITTGSGNYLINTSNSDVATASLSGSVITIKGVNIGTTNITISNSVDTPVTLTVKVVPTVAPAGIIGNPKDLHLSDLVFVEGGTFQMGTPSRGDGDELLHTVTLSSFNITKYEITNEQYAKFLNTKGNQIEEGAKWYQGYDIVQQGNSFVVKSGREKHPVVYVTWQGAKAYADWVGGYLPTEAQWEYAARGGNKSQGYLYSGSNDLNEVSWNIYNSGSLGIRPVGGKKPNELGIYDMSGNVWEWTADWYGTYSTEHQTNPTGPTTGTARVRRGASAFCLPNVQRTTNRSYRAQTGIRHNLGFRLVFK